MRVNSLQEIQEIAEITKDHKCFFQSTYQLNPTQAFNSLHIRDNLVNQVTVNLMQLHISSQNQEDFKTLNHFVNLKS